MQPSGVEVAGLSAGRQSNEEKRLAEGRCSSLADRLLGKDEVTSSILVIGSSLRSRMQAKAGAEPATCDYGWRAIWASVRQTTNLQSTTWIYNG